MGTNPNRIAVTLDAESRKQIEALSKIFRLNISSVVAMAIARWFHNEPLVGKFSKVSEHGDDHAGV